jgi:hypothetical protein
LSVRTSFDEDLSHPPAAQRLRRRSQCVSPAFRASGFEQRVRDLDRLGAHRRRRFFIDAG